MNNKETIQRALGLIEGICRAAELPENIQSALFDALEQIDAALQEPEPTRQEPKKTNPASPPQKLEAPRSVPVIDPLAPALQDKIDQLGIDLPTAARKIGTREAVLQSLLRGEKIRSDSREKIDLWVRTAETADTVQE